MALFTYDAREAPIDLTRRRWFTPRARDARLRALTTCYGRVARRDRRPLEQLMAPSSFEYKKPWLLKDPEPSVCPHCKQEIQPGDSVHWYDGTLWHTKPCPS